MYRYQFIHCVVNHNYNVCSFRIFAPWQGRAWASVSSECYTKTFPLFKSCWKLCNYDESVSSHFKVQWFLFRWCNWCSLYPWSEQSWVCCLQVKYKKMFIIWFASSRSQIYYLYHGERHLNLTRELIFFVMPGIL